MEDRIVTDVLFYWDLVRAILDYALLLGAVVVVGFVAWIVWKVTRRLG